MDQFPIELLVKIFAHLSSSQLLRMEQVCRRWQRVIQENYWNQLETVTEETIGYQFGDYLNNFIRLSARVVQVKSFVDPFYLMKDLLSHHEMEGELCRATLAMTRKLSIDAAFPLDVIRNVVEHRLNTRQSGKISKSAVRSLILATINAVVDESRIGEFQSLRILHLFVHSQQRDAFVIRWSGEQVRVPLDTARITRLIVGSLVIRLAWSGWNNNEPQEQALNTIDSLLQLKHLEFVEIESVNLVVHPFWDGIESSFDMIIEFHPDHRYFDIGELQMLLGVLSLTDDYVRNTEMAQYVKKWKEHGRVKRVDLSVGSEFFRQIDAMYHLESDCRDLVDDYFFTMITEVFPSYVDTLHLIYEQDSEEEDIMDTLKSEGVLCRLKELCVSFACERIDEDMVALWETKVAVRQIRAILRTIKDSLHSLHSLKLRFTAGGEECPSCMFTCRSVVVQDGPFPHLLNLECVGLPSPPFILSVVSQAPNLRRLSIGSQPFQCDPLAIRWITTLIDSLDACPRLEFLQISVTSVEKLSDVYGQEHPDKRPTLRKFLRNHLKVTHLLNVIDLKLQALRTRTCLSHLVVMIDSWEYYFVISKELNYNNVD